VRAFSTVVVAVVLGSGPAAWAQGGVATVGNMAQTEQMHARFQISAMEGVLERAVQLGARRLSQQVQAVSPDMLFIAGAARAKGFRLDGYGVFFDVDVPAMRRSIAWQFRTLDRGDRDAEAAVRNLREKLGLVHDAQLRRDMEGELERIEKMYGPMPASTAGIPGTTPVSASAAGPAPAPAREPNELLDDPGTVYTNEVKSALIDAMLDYGAPIPIADTEWLTIAARDSDDSRMGGGDPYDVSTIILRIKGADLAGLRSGQLSRDQARSRVEIREY
jgi:hypothetical protein